MKTAKFIKKLTGTWKGDARLYRLSEPVRYDYDYEKKKDMGKTRYVVVSAAYAMFTGPETYIFPADISGNVLNWGELDGSSRGRVSHESALKRAGYIVIKEDKDEKKKKSVSARKKV